MRSWIEYECLMSIAEAYGQYHDIPTHSVRLPIARYFWASAH
jgi:hypothetical protein